MAQAWDGDRRFELCKASEYALGFTGLQLPEKELRMNKKLLTAALLGGLSVAHAASAQEFDDRWYLTGSAGSTSRTVIAPPKMLRSPLGLGKFVSPNWSLDGELNYQKPTFDSNKDLNWSQYGISFDLRRHFIKEGRGWNPTS
jgi:OOP family OmpA-OmpF porin